MSNLGHKRPPQVVVTWLDACGLSNVHGTLAIVLSEAQLVKRETIGYLLRYDDKLTVLAHDYDPSESPEEEDEFGNITVIPSDWVISVKQGRKKLHPTPPEPVLAPPIAPSEPSTSAP